MTQTVPQPDVDLTADLAALAAAVGDVASVQVDLGGDRPVEIRPLKVRQLPAFARALQPALPVLAPLFAADDDVAAMDVVALLGSLGDDLIDAVAIGAALDRDAIEELEIDKFLELAMAVLQVNLDFFIRRLLPTVGRQVQKLTQATGTPSPSA